MPERHETPLGRALAAKKKSTAWLAHKIGWAESYLDQIADGHLRPGFSLCFKLIHVFGVQAFGAVSFESAVQQLREFRYTSVVKKTKTEAA